MKTRLVAVGGEPGVGKSTIARRLLSEHCYSDGFFFKVALLQGIACRGYAGTKKNVLVLGRYPEGERFPGTDRLSMAVQPTAETVLRDLDRIFQSYGLARVDAVIFEGDRLFTSSFLRFCLDLPTLDCRICVVESVQAEARRAARPKLMTASWLAGRRTKIENIKAAFPVQVVRNDGPNDLDAAVATVRALLLGD